MRIILLLFYWPLTKGTPENYAIDLVATTTENLAKSLIENVGTKTDSSSLSSSTEPNENIFHSHYESTNQSHTITETTPKYRTKDSTPLEKQQINLENDLYSSDVRMFLNQPSSMINRRSFDTQDGQKEFEILKVKDQTPPVANYHEFYENLKNNMHNNAQPSMESARNVPYHRTGERIKQIENYLNYDINQQRSNSNPYSVDYTQENTRDTQKKTAYEREKVHNNYHQFGASNYDIFGESVTQQRTTNIPLNNYENIDIAKKNQNKLTLLSKQRQSKPLVVVEPGDYKINLHYGNQQLASKPIMSTIEPYHNLQDPPEDRYDKDDEYSEENNEYYEITERPRRLHKSRRKPSYSDSSKKLPKEHRGTSSNESDELKKINSLTRPKSQRTRAKPSYWSDTNQSQEDNNNPEENPDNPRLRKPNNNDDNQQNGEENSSSWNQIAPNIEFSQSNGYELSQIDKPNLLVPINLNLVPLTNFDHSSAIGSSQGFDFTNAGITNFIAGGMVSTAAPLVSSTSPILMSNISPQSPIKNGQNIDNGNYAYSTAMPDVIVGQNSYQNTVQAVLLPQSIHNKYTPNLKTYYQSTSSPMLTVGPGIHGTSSTKSNTQHVTAVPQIFYPSSTLHSIIQSPGQPSTNYNILVNPHGLNGQNNQPTSHYNIHSNNNSNNNNKKNNDSNGNAPSSSVGDKQSKQSTFTGSNGQFLASASFSVGQGTQSSNAQANNNNYYLPTTMNNANNNIFASSQNNPALSRPQLQADVYPKIKTFIPAQVFPAFVQTATGITGINVVNQNQQQQQHQLMNVGNNIYGNTWGQLQQFQPNQNHPNGHNNRLLYQNIYTNKDNIGSTSNSNANTINAIQGGNVARAQLPVVGVQTVEIQNPNIYIKPNPVDVSGMNQYPTAVLTTPIPIFSSAQSFLTPRPSVTSTTPESMSIQSYVDSLTQIGSQNNLGNRLEQKTNDQNQFSNRPMYNPMSFVPNVEVVQSQTLLNGKILDESLPPQLNLVPVIPGGKFYKHSNTAQMDLISKPKLSSDLEKYAEEMFKESIRTIYNTQKWNLDKRLKNYTTSNDGIDFERLKSDLERYKAAMSGSKYNVDLLEAHHSEPQVHSTKPGRIKRPGLSVADIEELFKNDFKFNSMADLHSSSSSRYNSSNVEIPNDYLTPPRLHSFVSKSPYVDNKKPTKKRPGKTRPQSRPSTNSHGSRPKNLEASSSNHVPFSHRRPHHNRNSHNDYRKSKNLENYPTFTTSSPDISMIQTLQNDHIDINHPRMHNYLGLLMKNKQLPTGSATSVLRDEDDFKQYFDDNRRQTQINSNGVMQSVSPPYIQQYH
ncbi:hypothetical protein PV325_004981 [Microctonus aethiopoides]|nr:hypothetical protein PV325_004981 [Microctonus aethiopoides]